MSKVCEICGTEYGADAAYCNLCKKESLLAVSTKPAPAAPPEPLMADPPTLAFISVVWLLGLGYLLAEVRPSTWLALFFVWLSLAAITWAVCFAMRNTRMAAIFSSLGLVFCAIYGLLQL